MSVVPGFGVLLERLLDRRGLDVRDVPSRAGVPESEFQSVLGGMVPVEPLVQALASVLGWHSADLFVVAGVPVPKDQVLLEPGTGGLILHLVREALELPPELGSQVLEFLRSRPQQDRARPVPPVPEVYDRFSPGLGGMLVCMLGNRNLDWLSATELLTRAGGPILSGSMVGSVGLRRREVTPRLLASFAVVLGIPAGDLAAIGGMEVPDATASRNPAAAEMAALIWEARRLAAWQLREALEYINILRQR